MNRRTSVVLALLLLALLGFLLWPRDTDQANGTDRNEPPSQGKSAPWFSDSSQTPSKLPRSDPSHRGPHATHGPEELKHFIIPTLTTQNATVDQALTALFEQYNEICLNTGETPLKFNYRIKGTPSSALDLDLRQTSFLRALRIIAARSGLILERDGTSLVFLPCSQRTTDSLQTTKYALPPTFASELSTLFFKDPSLPVAQPSLPDRFDVSKVSATSDLQASQSSPPLVDMLRAMGIIRSSNANFSYPSGQPTLNLEASPADQERFMAFLNEEFVNVRPGQLKTVTKIVDSPKPLSFNSSQFTTAEFQDLMRTVTQTDGVAIHSQPEVAARPGQAATVEVIREVIVPNPDQDGEFKEDWIGVKTLIYSGGYGFDLQSSITQESRSLPDDFEDIPRVKGITAADTRQFPAGTTFVIESTTPEGTPRYIFTTTERLGPDGRPYDPRHPDE